jgi:hypothetical protein
MNNISLRDLAPLPLWVSWRRPKKEPLNPRNGRLAKVNDASTWATRSEAEDFSALNRADGVGIMLGNGRIGIDLDTCIENGAVAAWAQIVVERFQSYTEISPSGNGIKIFARIAEADAAAVEYLFPGKDGWSFKKYNGCEHPPGIEIYKGGRYFTVTDEQVGDEDSLREVSVKDLRWLLQEHVPSFFPPKNNASGHDNSRSAKAFRKGAVLKAGGASYEEMRDALLTDPDPEIAEWARAKGLASRERQMHRVFDNAQGCGAEGVTLEDFRSYMPMHSYIFTPCREMWPAASVNARVLPVPLIKDGAPILDDKGKQIKQLASMWLDRNRPVECMTWAPGEDMLISNRLISGGGWIERNGVATFNLYRPPQCQLGDPEQAAPWVDHAYRVFGDNAKHIGQWLAHRVQRPGEKINHALLLGGAMGVGKDSLLAPARYAIGPWNFKGVSPRQAIGRFNGFLKCVILCIDEARDPGDVDRYAFYDHMKTYIAAPPDVLLVDEKHLREHYILNCCGVIITSNHKTDGIYLPADDRRHFVAWCNNLTKDDFTPAYWNTLWSWYYDGGFEHVAAYLAALDISTFDPKAPPTKTPEFWDIVDASRAPEDAELADLLDEMGNPEAATLTRMLNAAIGSELELWLRDRKNRRALPYRLEKCGYVPIRNDAAKDGLWKIQGTRQVIYARAVLSIGDRFRAARKLADGR